MSSSRPNPKAICILILEILLCITVYLLCVCLRRRRRRPAAVHATVTISATTNQPPPRGLDPAVVASFPIIPYAAVSDFAGGPHRRPSPELDCAVCLSAFQEDETLRFIPKCEHVFHPHCVDPWLALHTTCPYCRASLGPGPADSDRPENSSAGEVVIQVTVTNGVSGESSVSPECGRYTLRLPDEILRNFVPGNGGRVGDRSLEPEKDVRR